MIVVDASVAVKWFVREDGHEAALSLLGATDLAAPDLIFSETANVLWKKLRRGEVTVEQARRACRDLPDFFDGIVSTAALAEDALDLAQRLDHPVYDCIYFSCAQRQGTKLITADAKFRAVLAADGLNHFVVALEDAPSIAGMAGSSLSISDSELDRLLRLYTQFRRTISSVEDVVGRPFGSGSAKIVNTADLRPVFDSPAYRNLQSAIRDLPQENIGDLVALGWLGRGFDGHDWERLRQQAEAISSEPQRHLGYIVQMLAHASEGARKLGGLRDHAPSPNVSPDTESET